MKIFILILFSCLAFLQVVSAQQNFVRKPSVAGAFYPGDSKKLTKMIKEYLNRSKVIASDLEIYGMISPHAGYVYSGLVAAQGYKQLVGRKYDAVIVISPSHAEYFPFSSVMENGSYQTPLGKLKIDQQLSKKIASGRKTIQLSEKGHFQSHLRQKEHALEVQIPFIQTVFGDVPIVAIVMGKQSNDACEELSESIVKASKNKKVLILASSDLSHFHSSQQAKQIDENCVSLIADYNYKELFNQLNSKKVEACGGAPIVTMLMATEKMGAEKVKILMYTNSGDVTGDKSSVVGYLSAIVVKQKESKQEENETSGEYSRDERKELIKIARVTIENSVNRKSIPEFQIKSDKLKEKRGAFVTINKFGQLRGCIGYTQPIFPLFQTIQHVAKAAAFEDPRFSPVTPNELKNLIMEISVLTLPEKIENVDEIEVGKHGLIIKQNYFQGLLLPQVASDYEWNRTTFLEQTCRKAGLKKDAWKDKNTEIFIFSAEVFGEH